MTLILTQEGIFIEAFEIKALSKQGMARAQGLARSAGYVLSAYGPESLETELHLLGELFLWTHNDPTAASS